MYYREIGSEFHFAECDAGAGIKFPRSGTLTFSGRTAIEAVLKKMPQARTALLPSYCCDSMIDPFRRAGISCSFFDVSYKDRLTVDLSGKKADILLWCNYFGFKNQMPYFDGVIIEDITHSLFSAESHHSDSDYLVASVRKWEPICCGGYCSVDAELEQPPLSFLDDKVAAMKMKSEYLKDLDAEKKPIFLSAFKTSNEWLAENYSSLAIDAYSKEYISNVDMVAQREIRRRNARILYEGLRNKIEFMFDEELIDCPLFVPMIIREKRDEIRRYLAENNIYCPVHWPRPLADCSSNLYDIELSLICDQRYDENDMERIVSVLNNKL